MKIFVTGASGWIGSAVVPELINAGHQVVGLARSDASAEALTAAGAEVRRGTIDNLDILSNEAAKSDGVIHLAFKHDLAFTGDFVEAAKADRQVVETCGEALNGSDKPFVIASGLLGLIPVPGYSATEEDGLVSTPATIGLDSGPDTRRGTAHAVLALATKGIRSSVVRLSPTVHGDGDNGFMATLVSIARAKGTSGYIGNGSNRWPAIHRLDAAQLFRLALEKAPTGSTLHGVAEEGIATREIAEVIGRHLNIPVVSISIEDAGKHFGFLANFFALDSPVSSVITRRLLSWQPTHLGLIEDLDKGHYFNAK
jgi:nucleoside-diphosphate-sugar epimerase